MSGLAKYLIPYKLFKKHEVGTCSQDDECDEQGRAQVDVEGDAEDHQQRDARDRPIDVSDGDVPQEG